MAELSVAFLGDVVGSVGRRAVAQAVPILRERHGVRVVVVNGENSRQGSGITPEHVRELKAAGVHALTLGDHCYKDRAIIPMLEDPEWPIARPANLSARAPGKRMIRVEVPGFGNLYVVTVLGRIYMPMASDSPFDAVDREVGAIRDDQGGLVLVEVHGEVTSEKQAMVWHCLEQWGPGSVEQRRTAGRPTGGVVVGVVGSHTHVQTADGRMVDYQVAAITDLGMCGPYRGVIGRSTEATLRAMVQQVPAPLDVANDDPRVTGVVLRLDPVGRRAVGIEAVNIGVRG
jgi:calcineurin-like phosphoesterase